ncbi:hypothetical protein INF60_22465, partial [Enterobacter cloacae complex sp. P9RS]
MYAVGDASTIDRDVMGYVVDNFAKFDKDLDGKLTLSEFAQFINVLRRKFPIASSNLQNVRKLLNKYDFHGDHQLNSDEVVKLVQDATKD